MVGRAGIEEVFGCVIMIELTLLVLRRGGPPDAVAVSSVPTKVHFAVIRTELRHRHASCDIVDKK